MVEHQETTKEMENLNIIIELNEDGKMENFDIALRGCDLPYENTDEYEYEVEEFEKTKELQHKEFNCLLARELNCFACAAIYRFQLIFVKRKRKVPIIEYAPTVRNTIVTSNPVPIVRQQYHQSPQTQHLVKVVSSPKVVSVPVVRNNVKTVPMRNTVTYQQPVVQQATRRVVIAQQQPVKRDDDGQRIRQMIDQRRQQQQTQQQNTRSQQNIVKKVVTTHQKPQNLAQRIVYSHATKTVPDIGSSEEDIETEVIDSSMVECEMTSNSNSPLPKTKSKVVVQREPTVSVMEEEVAAAAEEPNPLKCDMCHKEFHSLRQRERHRGMCPAATAGRQKSVSVSDEGAMSPIKQSPKTLVKRTTGSVAQSAKRAKLVDPLEEEIGDDSEN
ncbi:uncharacterized protein LOC134830341 [Culicoides brevitarsis]|uniref:uncharacterized protein LOC134830341 n=1 Tax=Culicoides brevitarsis TaxID=469753 RepID=UPI00307B8A44